LAVVSFIGEKVMEGVVSFEHEWKKAIHWTMDQHIKPG